MGSILNVTTSGLDKIYLEFDKSIAGEPQIIAIFRDHGIELSSHINLPFPSDASPLGIIISIVVLIVTPINLLLYFDFIDKASTKGLLKYMEWYGAFGLMVTVIWPYLEFLILLSKLRSRN